MGAYFPLLLEDFVSLVKYSVRERILKDYTRQCITYIGHK